MPSKNARKYPQKRDLEDGLHVTTKAALATIPIIGGPAVELFSAVVTPSLEKRRIEWLNALAAGLEDLQQRVEGFSIESLTRNEVFISNVLQASQVALRNHHEEKLKALRNAVINSLTRNPPSEDQQSIFLNYIDVLTPWHLRILKFFEDPRVWGEKNGVEYPNNWTSGGPSAVLEHTFPDLRGERELYDQIVRDLYSRGLMSTDASSLHMTMTESGMFAGRTTALGKNFINFISLDESKDLEPAS